MMYLVQIQLKTKDFKIDLQLPERVQQHNFIYPLIFQEYIYALVHDRDLKKFRFQIVKRLINRMYNSNSSNKRKISGLLKSLYYKLLSAGFSFLFEIPFFFKFISERKKILKSQNLRSIHSIFPFLEDNLSHLKYVLDLLIPDPPHPEILVQKIRYWVQDASSLHLLRFFLHEFCSVKSLITTNKKSKIKERFLFLLHNSYISEYESIFLVLRNQSIHLGSISFVTLFERNIFYGKIECFVELFAQDLQANLRLFKDTDPSMHYARYRGKSILASNGGLLLMPKWKYYIVNFWQCYFYMWFHTERINISQIASHPFYLMDYISSIAQTPSMVRSKMLENSFLINKDMKIFETFVPILPIIGSLAKAQFCNLLGNPISKPVWADFSDSDILERFGRICRNIFHYYSGSSKKRSLYQLKYILRLSCARTLARKHKSTVRGFLQSLGLKLLEEFFTSEEQILFLTFPNASLNLRGVSKGRIWYFDIVCINEQAHFK
nr:maturase K [Cuscuta japonica]UKO31930.1 maturase K [Cuscuta japonica]